VANGTHQLSRGGQLSPWWGWRAAFRDWSQTPLSSVTDVVDATNEVRARVVRALEEYIELSDRMRRLEDTFSIHVLHTAARLHETIGHRRRLESEYERIRARIDSSGYASAAELADDVRSVLTTTETEYPDAGAGAAGQPLDEVVVAAPDEGFDAASRERIVREFKRIVLPNVHADTSDAPYAIFDVAYSAYKTRDYTIMDAFVIRFRTVTAEDERTRLPDYLAAERRLDRRLRELRRDATYEELHDAETARQRMLRQNDEFRRAIDEEAERLEAVRTRLQALLREQAGVA
jgi:hypothetical protein